MGTAFGASHRSGQSSPFPCTTPWFLSHVVLPAGSQHTTFLQSNLTLYVPSSPPRRCFSVPSVPGNLTSLCQTPLGWRDRRHHLPESRLMIVQADILPFVTFILECVPVPLLLRAGIPLKTGTCFVFYPQGQHYPWHTGQAQQTVTDGMAWFA